MRIFPTEKAILFWRQASDQNRQVFSLSIDAETAQRSCETKAEQIAVPFFSASEEDDRADHYSWVANLLRVAGL
ncbi:hypothetical protein [Shimia thalassica]|uniref:hypothetical protein n=1 Tax=Shimia thalassica TaxID=1715693 RepID=UPI0026E429F0|nr:hypothetical protein [Shimia thalassica]